VTTQVNFDCRTIGEAVDVDAFDAAKARDTHYVRGVPSRSSGRRPCVFLSVFKWEERKGWKFLLKAFIIEFAGSDDVVLAILSNAYHSSEKFDVMINEFVANDVELQSLALPRVSAAQSAPFKWTDADCHCCEWSASA
jgi:hypothetical protein